MKLCVERDVKQAHL